METTEIIDNLKETFNITRSRSVIARSNLSKHNFISRKKNTLHIDDVFYMVYGFILGPGNFKEAKIFYSEMLENEAFIIKSFAKMQSIGFNNIKNVTFGHWYIIVNCNDPVKNFTLGKIDNKYTDRSKTVTGEKLDYFFSKLT
jgi:hypothetical protein